MLQHVLSCLAYKLLLALVGAWYLLREQVWDRHRSLPALPQQAGRVVVVTGGGRGIGEQAVRLLVKLGARVIVGVRRPDTVREVLADLGPGVEVLELDLLRQQSVRAFAAQVLERSEAVHVLINSAGIMFGPRRETEEGWESQLATNYLGHFLLSHLLLPGINRGGTAERPARIVNVSSCAHLLGSWLDLADLQLAGGYVPEQAYGNSKAAQLMFAGQLGRELAGRGAPVRVLSLHPGVIYTNLYSSIPGIQWLAAICRLIMKTPEQGGESLVQAALDPALDTLQGPVYLVNSRPVCTSRAAADRATQEGLWRHSCRLFDIDPARFGL